MDEAVRKLGLLLGLVGGPIAASLGYLVTLQLLTRAGWFTTDETSSIEIVSVAFEVPVSRSKWHSAALHAISVLGMVSTFVIYVSVVDLVFSVTG